MGILNFLKKSDINEKMRTFGETEHAVLLDVRTGEEYAQGHIPGSVNLPLQRIFEASGKVNGKDTPLFVYCQSGARSANAALWLKKSGYTNVTDMGGITHFGGKLETGGSK